MRSRAQAPTSRHRRPSWAALALSAVLGVSAALVPVGSASAAVPTGYVVASGWSTSGTGATATQIGGTSYLGAVTSTAGNQVVGMDAAWTVDGTAVPRRQLTTATINASDTECLNGAPVDTVRECNGGTSKITTVVFPKPTVNPIIAVATRGAVYTLPATGTSTRTFCSTAWLDHTVTSVSGSSAFSRAQVTALTVPAGQRYNTATTELFFDTTLMTPTAAECVAPAAGTGTVAYLQVQGVVSSVQFQTRYRAMVTRNNAPVQSTRMAAVPPGWQVQPMFAQADLAITKSATTRVPATGDIEWQLAVRNKGTGPSHGFQVDDVVPLGVSDVMIASSPIPCTIGTETIGGVPRQVVRCSAEPPDCIVVPDPSIPGWAEPLCDVEDRLVPSVLAAGASAGPIVIRARAGTTPGQVANTATVAGADIDPVRTDNSAAASTDVVPASPSVALTGAVTPASPATLAPGARLDYAFTVTNSGDIPLTGAVVVDDEWSGAGPAPSVSCPAGPIAVSASTACSASHTVTQADIDAGGVSLTATALATSAAGEVTSTAVTLPTTLTRTAGIALVHTGSPASVTAVGETVIFSYAVTNTGTVTLADLRVTEDAFTGAGAAPVISCPPGDLAPGGETVCTADYIVVAEDAGSTTVTSTATASAAPPAGVEVPSATDTAVVDVAIPVPDITFEGSADPAGPFAAAPGDEISYRFTARNSGNTPLTYVDATFIQWSGAGPAPIVACAEPQLAVGAETGCTATYAITQSDIDAGGVTGSAQARAGSAGGAAASGTVPLATTLIRTAGIALAPTASPSTVTAVGQVVEFRYAVTNTGTTSLTDPSVSATAFSGRGTPPTITCPTGVLEPSATLTCSASYTVVEADVPFTSLTSTVTAGAQAPPGVESPQSPAASASVDLGIAALTFAKEASVPEDTELVSGERLTYTLTASNTGGALLDPLVITDDLRGVLTAGVLEAGAAATVDGLPAGSVVVDGEVLRWTGSLAPGGTVVVTYSVVTGTGPSTLRNSARAEGTSPADITVVTADVTTTHAVAAPVDPVDPVDPVGPGPGSGGAGTVVLPESGGDARLTTALAVLAAMAIIAGGLISLHPRSRRRT